MNNRYRVTHITMSRARMAPVWRVWQGREALRRTRSATLGIGDIGKGAFA